MYKLSRVVFLSLLCSLFLNFAFFNEARATGASMEAVFPSNSFQSGTVYTAHVYLNTAGNNVVAAYVVATYDKTIFQIISATSSGSNFGYTAYSNVDASLGKIKIAVSQPTPGINLSKALLATISVKALSNFTGFPLALKFSSMNAIDDCAVIADDGKGTNILATVSTNVNDTIPPLRLSGQPSGALIAGTKEATLKLDTDELSTCRYGIGPNSIYSSLPNEFSGAGTKAHSSVVTGLADGKSYSYYVRCKDVSGNANADDFLISFSVLSGSTGSSTNPAQGYPVAILGFNEKTGQFIGDSSGNNNNGYLGKSQEADSSDPKRTIEQPGDALTFDGKKTLAVIPAGPKLIFANGFTYSAWIYPQGWGDSKKGVIFSREGEVEGSGFSAYLSSRDSNSLMIRLKNDSGAEFITQVQSSQFKFRSWQHLTVTFDSGGDKKAHAYINGAEVKYKKQDVFEGSLGNSSNPFVIGGSLAAEQGFKGIIDEVVVWNRALAPEEIGSLAVSEDGALIRRSNSYVKLSSSSNRTYDRLVAKLSASQDFRAISQADKYILANFLKNGSPLTKKMGLSKRETLLNDYIEIYSKLPSTQAEWEDFINISRGKFPQEKSAKAESSAKYIFEKIYLRSPQSSNTADSKAVSMIAYRPVVEKRSYTSERFAIKVFHSVYGRNPKQSADWAIVRAVAYSGAVR